MTATIVQPNANFHTASQNTVFASKNDEQFREYRHRWNTYPQRFIVGNFPIHLDIESTSACNLKCPFCAVTYSNWGPQVKGYITAAMYKNIVDEGVHNGLYSIKLSFRGEPLLHPKLPWMISHAKHKGIIDIYFNTNATLLTDQKINQLINAELDRISISFEGTSKKVYELHRPGAVYESVLSNIRLLRSLRDKFGLSYPQIRVQEVLLPELKDELQQYVEFWSPIADEVSYLDARRETPGDDHRGLVANWACPFLWQRMVVLWDGTILPCLMHGVQDFSLMSLGNVHDVSIKQVWNSDALNHYRELHKSGQAHKIEACDICSYRAMELEKLQCSKI